MPSHGVRKMQTGIILSKKCPQHKLCVEKVPMVKKSSLIQGMCHAKSPLQTHDMMCKCAARNRESHACAVRAPLLSLHNALFR